MLLGVTGKSAQIPLVCLAARRDGWPNPGFGPDPCRDDGHRWCLPGGALVPAVPVGSRLRRPAVTWVGAITALFAATIAVGQFDIKRVLAYSTISQLGFMVAAVGMGAYTAGMFHLITHAFFKALLFLSAGSVILGMERGQEAAYGHGQCMAHGHEDFDPQDMRNMGGLRSKMPVTFWVYLVGALALAGIAPLSGSSPKMKSWPQPASTTGGVLSSC